MRFAGESSITVIEVLRNLGLNVTVDDDETITAGEAILAVDGQPASDL